jgi:GC-rich sequence DNA-binding factor
MCAGFDAQQWYQQLFDYGMATASSGAAANGHAGGGDADEELVPKLVRELVLPLAAHALAHAWRPVSARESRAAAALLADLLVYVPAEEPAMAVRALPDS